MLVNVRETLIKIIMDNQPLISVIIPVYNVENYLRECLDSVLNQTYSFFEVIIINDGSTDTSGTICDKYMVKDARIKVLHQQNRRLGQDYYTRYGEKQMKYLFVIAHPDDEADMGGMIFKLRQRGEDVAVSILVGKVAARRHLSDSLNDEESASMNILGVQKVYHADFPNIKTNIVPHLELVQFIETCIEDWGAEAIVMHHTADVNIDHAISAKAAIAACRLFQRKEGVPRLRLLLMGETACATEWALDSAKNRFTPNFFIEIEEDGLNAKIEAHAVYKGVMRPYPHPESAEVYRGLAAYRGAQAGLRYAEAYECVFRSE